jgi:SAM-dependent MidA family methyltransferase
VAAYLPQAQFLLASGLQGAFELAHAKAPDDFARHRLAQEVRRLTMPEQMGERFQAMLFARGLDVLPLAAELLAADQGGRL